MMPSTRARTSEVRMACSRAGSSIVLAIGWAVTTMTRTSGGGGAAAGGADFEQAARNRAAPTRRTRPDLIIEGGYSGSVSGATAWARTLPAAVQRRNADLERRFRGKGRISWYVGTPRANL